VDLQNIGTSLLVRQRELDLAVQTTGSEQSRVQNVDTVGRGQDLDTVIGCETVQLVQKLQHGTLHFTITGLL
jgi:hypothetical protein